MEIAIRPIDSHGISKEEMHHEVGSAHEPSPERFAHIAPYSIMEFWQFARVDVSGLPSLVEQAINKGIQVLDTKLPPFMWISQNGHDDVGAVLYVRDIHNNDLKDCSRIYLHGKDRGLVARISFGPESKVKNDGWRFSNFGRLHISAYAFRTFLPIDSNLKISEKECLSEEIHLPLRWFKDKKKEWQFDNPYVKGCENKETRTPWKRLTKEPYHQMLIKLSKRKNFITFSQGLNRFGQEEGENRPIETTHSGYPSILETLSNFGNVSPEDKVTEMSPEQGVGYLFGKVLPAMKKFVNSG